MPQVGRNEHLVHTIRRHTTNNPLVRVSVRFQRRGKLLINQQSLQQDWKAPPYAKSQSSHKRRSNILKE
jgi:hypothetical protein